jgi:hypothetical protein
MTCRGYDAKAVKLPKSVKRVANTFVDPHKRGAFIKSYVEVLKTELRQPGGKK